jgi:hypothetical protein
MRWKWYIPETRGIVVDVANDRLCAISIGIGIVDDWQGSALWSRSSSHDCAITREHSSKPLRVCQDILHAHRNRSFDVQEYCE